jgi:hypothetical protein
MEPKTAQNLDGYGAPLIPWSKVRERIELGFTQAPGTGGPDRHTAWLATVQPDGRPHVMPLGILWADDAFYFTAGPGTRKAKNLAHDPRCALTIAAHDFDLIVEGKAARITDPTRVQRIAEAFRTDGWPATATEDGLALTADYSAPSAGPPPWYVYQIMPETVFAMGTAEPYGATRWRV